MKDKEFTNEKLYKEWMSRFDEKNPPHMRDAFEAGMEAARPQWHDLRKDPNDLPPKEDWFYSQYVVVALNKHSWTGRYNYELNRWDETTRFCEISDVIAWMPLPEWKGGEQ